MSMYDLVAGDGNQQARGRVLLALIGSPDVGRFRDAWVERSPETGDPLIAVYTRNGGGNRECFCAEGDHETYGPCTAEVGEALTRHPAYVRDADDEFDSTYATYWFRVLDDEARELLRAHAGAPVDMSERWLAAIDRLTAAAASNALDGGCCEDCTEIGRLAIHEVTPSRPELFTEPVVHRRPRDKTTCPDYKPREQT